MIPFLFSAPNLLHHHIISNLVKWDWIILHHEIYFSTEANQHVLGDDINLT